eukprot:gene31859-7066_t
MASPGRVVSRLGSRCECCPREQRHPVRFSVASQPPPELYQPCLFLAESLPPGGTPRRPSPTPTANLSRPARPEQKSVGGKKTRTNYSQKSKTRPPAGRALQPRPETPFDPSAHSSAAAKLPEGAVLPRLVVFDLDHTLYADASPPGPVAGKDVWLLDGAAAALHELATCKRALTRICNGALMRLSWYPHGTLWDFEVDLMGFSWNCNGALIGLSQGSERILMRLSWYPHGTLWDFEVDLMGFSWNCNGALIGLSQGSERILMRLSWYPHGTLWDFEVDLMGFSWNCNGALIGLSQGSERILMRLSWCPLGTLMGL